MLIITSLLCKARAIELQYMRYLNALRIAELHQFHEQIRHYRRELYKLYEMYSDIADKIELSLLLKKSNIPFTIKNMQVCPSV